MLMHYDIPRRELGRSGVSVSVIMVEVFRRRVVWLLVEKELLDEDFAIKLLSWKHSDSASTTL